MKKIVLLVALCAAQMASAECPQGFFVCNDKDSTGKNKTVMFDQGGTFSCKGLKTGVGSPMDPTRCGTGGVLSTNEGNLAAIQAKLKTITDPASKIFDTAVKNVSNAAMNAINNKTISKPVAGK